MDYSKKSKSNHGMQRRLFEMRGIRKKVYKKVCKMLKEMNIEESDIETVISAVQSGNVQLGIPDLEKEINALARMDKEIKKLENKLNSNANSANESGMSL